MKIINKKNMNNKEQDKRRIPNTKKYFLVLILTILIFTTGILLSQKLNDERIIKIKKVEDSIYIDILSSEIQFNLLEDIGCKNINEKTILSSELRELSKKINYMEREVKDESSEMKILKKKYEILQIKDYLLMKKLSKKCKLEPINILYFYSNRNEKISEYSKKELYILNKLEKDNPRLRVYYFDYDMPLSVVRTLLISKKNYW